MSMNPARTFASAAPGGPWTHAWIYYTAPILGMLAAVELYRRLLQRDTRRMCAKLDHPDNVRCIHCGHEPPAVQPPNPREANKP
jgi:aquaporin Z